MSSEGIRYVHRLATATALLMAVDVQLDVSRQQALRRIPAREIIRA